MHMDLAWATQMRVKRKKDSPKTHAPVLVVYIPWSGVHDFVNGGKTRTNGPCKFVCWGTPWNQHV